MPDPAGANLTYPIRDGATVRSPSGPFEDPKRPAPIGPFRRRVPGPVPPKVGPGFGLLAIDPDSYARGHRRLKLRHAAMATGAFAMMSVSMTVQTPTEVVPRKPAGAEQTAELKKPTKRPGHDGEDEEKARAAGAGDVAGATEPAARPSTPSSAPATASEAAAAPSEAPEPEPEPEPETETWRAGPVAEFAGIFVYEVSEQIQLVGFHEAAYKVAQPMAPLDPPSANHGRAHVPFHSQGHKRTAEVIVLPTRLRDTSPASAIDVAVKAGAPIVAPVDGVVTAVKPYNLYNKYPDYRIEIAPAGHPELQLTVLHVTGPQVAVGDALVAGQTPFAQGATLFPFESQIDRFSAALTGAAHPHVHMEFKYR